MIYMLIHTQFLLCLDIQSLFSKVLLQFQGVFDTI